MKKVYSKPRIFIESFSMSTNIAGNCDQINSVQTQGVCGLDFGGENIFLTGVSGCDVQFETDDGTSGICYHNPSETTQLFNS